MLGPVINVYGDEDLDSVNLTLAVNSHAFNVTWNLDSGNKQYCFKKNPKLVRQKIHPLPYFNILSRDEIELPDQVLESACVEERSRYQRFTVAKRDVKGRTYLGKKNQSLVHYLIYIHIYR